MYSTGRADSLAEAASRESEFFRDANGNQSSTRDENLALSSVGSSFFTTEDNLSLNSSTAGSALPTNIFAGMESLTTSGSHGIDESGDNTILSSNPSVSIPPPPEVSRDVFMLSPHPQLATVGVNSMSTMSTEVYPSDQVVFRDTTLGDRSNNDEASLSMASSQSTTVSALLGGDRRPVSGSFEDGAFERVASHMASDPDLPKDSGTNGWHDKLVSDSDWDRFRATSEALLPFISEEASESVSQCPLPLPPKPSGGVTSSSVSHLRAMYRTEDHLPPEFICGVCKDVLVGACIVESNRSSSCTVCMSCWEESDSKQQDFATQMDFVWVEESKKCPVYCHALDVAILRIVQDLPDSDDAVRALKQSYYHRLSVWRKKVSDRNERLRNEKMIRDDELLARLIQEEERVFWEQRNQRRPQERTKRIFGIPSSGFIVVSKAFLALLAIAGLKHMSKR